MKSKFKKKKKIPQNCVDCVELLDDLISKI